MMITDTEKVYGLIRETLNNFCGAVRYSMARHWRSMTITQQQNAARALVFMGRVAKDPAVYFSRLTTMEDWRARARKGFNPNANGHDYNACSPAEIVATRAGDAFEYALELRYYYRCFCNAVVDWEYDRTSVSALRKECADVHIENVRDIIENSKNWRMRHVASRRHGR